MKRNLLAISTLLGFLAGCAAVSTPDDYRAAIDKSRFGKVERFEVNRSVSQVTQSFKKKAAECLSYELTSTTKPTIGTSSTAVYAIATATVLQNEGKTELHFQVKSVGNLAPEPEKGNYFLIADVQALGKSKAQVVIRRVQAVAVAEAVRAWAAGNERGCPDPMRTFKG